MGRKFEVGKTCLFCPLQYVNYNTTCKNSVENRLALQVCIKIGLEGNYQGFKIKLQVMCNGISIPLKITLYIDIYTER